MKKRIWTNLSFPLGAALFLTLLLGARTAHAKKGMCSLSAGGTANAVLKQKYQAGDERVKDEIYGIEKDEARFLRSKKRTSPYKRSRCGRRKMKERATLVALRKYVSDAQLQC